MEYIMKRTSFFPLLLAVLFIGFNFPASAQNNIGVVGKIFTVQEANQLFGPVLTKVKFNTNKLKSFMKDSPEYLMFSLKNGNLKILNKNRVTLHPIGAKDVEVVIESDKEQFHIFSTSIIEELLGASKSAEVDIEIREEVLTITADGNTLEYAILCPPYCLL